MVNIQHTPIKRKCGDFNNHYTITGNSITEIVEFCLPRIREISKEFYKKERKTHWSALLPMGCKRQKYLQIKN